MRRRTTLIPGLAIDYRKTEAEQGMLLNLHKTGWTEGLKMRDHSEMHEGNEQAVKVREHQYTERGIEADF